MGHMVPLTQSNPETNDQKSVWDNLLHIAGPVAWFSGGRKGVYLYFSTEKWIAQCSGPSPPPQPWEVSPEPTTAQ